MEERDGQHMGVVTKALMKEAPPFSIILLVLFITCKDPAIRGTDHHCAVKRQFEYIGCYYAVKSKVSVISLPLNTSVLHSVALVILGEKITFLLHQQKYF